MQVLPKFHRNYFLELSSEGLFIQLKKIFCCRITLICPTKQQWFKLCSFSLTLKANNFLLFIKKHPQVRYYIVHANALLCMKYAWNLFETKFSILHIQYPIFKWIIPLGRCKATKKVPLKTPKHLHMLRHQNLVSHVGIVAENSAVVVFELDVQWE